ncbi:hypothetical protein SORBI_3002G325500 [Sorghum bicolor]|uniref:Uncharacterized protein n=1 Tax=Sorghum bicolor TaxID=4558 RepID=A0A1B6QEN6_SORBI|nr:hypothetical protein SORBI_3002G325500 [Sorghum bicolor]
MAFLCSIVTLGTDLFRVLTTGEVPRLVELLNASGEGGPQAADGHVAIKVNGGAVSPGAGTGSLLGVTSNGNTALHLVASRGHAELTAFVCDSAPSLGVVACLLSKMRTAVGGPDEAAALRARNCLGATALLEAVRLSRAGVVDLLMAEAPELASVTTEDGVSPLYLAAEVWSDEMVRLLLRPSPDGTPSPASFAGRDGQTALHSAATISKGMAREILNWEPVGPTLLTRVDSSGKTPLQFAILYRRLDVVEMFLDDHTSSEQAHISDNHGLFPVHSAAKVGSTRIIDVLIQKCPDYCELLDDKGRSLLHCAVEHNQESVVRHVCQNGTFVTLLNAMDSEGNTPLHLAVKYGCPRIVSLLLQTMSVKTGITNKDGLTAGDLAHRVLERGRMNYFLLAVIH